MNKGRLLLIISKSRYDALAGYIDCLGDEFEKMGYDVDYVDGREPGHDNKLYEYSYNNEYLAVIACNVILTGYDKLLLKNSIFCCLMFDHPIYHYERIKSAFGKTLVIPCDMKNAEYIARYCPNVESVGFVPLSGNYVEDIVPYKQREYDIVFTGSYKNPEELYNEYSAEASDSDVVIVNILIDIMKENVSLTLQEALLLFLSRQKIELPDKEFHKLMFQIRFADTYMKAWLREQVVRAIVDSGHMIHIFGEGWDKFECKHPENIIVMDGYGHESLKALANSKIALNVMPWFRGGFQERIASAMLCGAIALTDTSSYIEENFEDNVDIAIYDAQNPDSVVEKIDYLLNNPEEAETIAAAGYEKAHKYHTWRNRAKEIIDNINETIEWYKSIE